MPKGKKQEISAFRIRELMAQRKENGRLASKLDADRIPTLFAFQGHRQSAALTAHENARDALEKNNKEIEEQVGQIPLWVESYIEECKREMEQHVAAREAVLDQKIYECRVSLRACGVLMVISFIACIVCAVFTVIL